jgi:hypothetical protein
LGVNQISKWYGIILHHTACHDDPKAFDSDAIKHHHLALGWLDIGYNFVFEKVDQDLWMIGGRPLTMKGAHALGYNETHIGVSFVGNFEFEVPHPSLLAFAAPYIQALINAYRIPLAEIKRHSDVNITDCPGKYFPFDTLMMLLKEAEL